MMPIWGSKFPVKLLLVNKARKLYSKHANTESTQTLPSLESRADAAQSTAQTRYVDMLLDLDNVPRWHNLLASFSTWILLAGFLIVPGTFTSVEKSSMVKEAAKQNAVAHEVLEKVKNASLLWIAFSCCLVGVTGLSWLWWRWRSNYVWLINKIFL